MEEKDRDKSLLEYLTQFVSDEKLDLFKKILDERTRHITIVLEDIYQPHNASAVLRSCEGFGVQDVHVIENFNQFEVNKGVTIGAHKWLTVKKYNNTNHNNTRSCIDHLRKNGYRIVATSPHEANYELTDLPIENKTAIFFGAEKNGLSDYVLKEADEYLKIPMYGFSESFNISVSVAITLYDLINRMRNMDLNWHLKESEQNMIILEWLKRSIRRSDLIEQRYEGKLPIK